MIGPNAESVLLGLDGRRGVTGTEPCCFSEQSQPPKATTSAGPGLIGFFGVHWPEWDVARRACKWPARLGRCRPRCMYLQRVARHKMQGLSFCATTRNCACAGFPGRLHFHSFPPKLVACKSTERTVIRSVQIQLRQANRWPRPFFTHSLSP